MIDKDAAVAAAERNVADFRKRLVASIEPVAGPDAAPVIVLNIEGLILAHIQKLAAEWVS